MPTNRNFGTLDTDSKIVYAPAVIDTPTGTNYAPTEADYRAIGAYPIVSEPPVRVGMSFYSTERGELRDGTIYRIYGETPIVAPVIVHRYSKLKLITAAKAAGKWDALKAWISASGYADEWAACMYLADDYAGFDKIVAAVVSAGIATEDEIKAILAAAEDESLPMV